ncbi:hypothetical protein RND81_03G114900 [Saponaria officinalis]|uniref:Chaperone DnaJ-domain superfamily protein n=1 Tax=Saponaria officinalis TaxID=3572 RepID=A0AAW1M9W1_SAPOF
MTMSSTTSTCIYGEIIPSLSKHTNMCLIIACSKTSPFNISTDCNNNNGKLAMRRLIARSVEEAGSSSTTTEETWEGSESGSVEVAKGPPSIISALNVEKAFRGIAITDVDHYAKLGLQSGCSYESVRAAYEDKVKEVSSQGLDDEELNKELDLLKTSYRILSTEEERRLYDWSLARTKSTERYTWPFEVDITQTAIKGIPPAQEPENVGPTIAVGYFFLGWFILACILSIVLNQR